MKRTSVWKVMLIPGGVLFVVVVYYHFLRRGVVNPFGPHGLRWLWLANKGMAITGMLLAGFSVAVGPLARWSSGFRRWAAVRREIGLAGFWWIVLHVVASLMLYDRFSWSWYRQRPGTLSLGIISLLLLIIIAAASNRRALQRLGGRRWKRVQRLVYPALGLGMAHYMVIGKPASWLQWWRERPVLLPGGTLVLTVIMLLFLLIRLSAWIPRRSGQTDRGENNR